MMKSFLFVPAAICFVFLTACREHTPSVEGEGAESPSPTPLLTGSHPASPSLPDRTPGPTPGIPSLPASEYFPLDLSHAANRDFEDKAGKGWSGQGPQNDMKGFETGSRDFAGINFSILNPVQNGGRAVMTFDSPRDRTALDSATIDISGTKPEARYLYLLHTSCWNQEPLGMPIGTINVKFDDGTVLQRSIRNGVEVADWWNPGDMANAKVVVTRDNGASKVGVYLSRIELGDVPKRVESVTFATSQKAVWIVIAASLSSRDADLSSSTVVFAPGQDWKAVNMSDVQIKAGSALDLSSFSASGPAGKDGRAFVTTTGKLAFENDPSKPRRLLGFTAFLLRRLDGATPDETAERIKLYAGLIRRQGYDVIRPLALDMYLGDGSTNDREFNPVKLNNADLLLSELKKQGVYTYLSIAAYRVGRRDFEKAMAETYIMKARMYLGDAEMRRNWQSTAERLLLHVNPHTGVAWKDEPAIACLEFYNEQELGLRLGSLDAATKQVFQSRWNAWLEVRYGNLPALSKAWGKAIRPGEDALGKVALPDSLDGATGDARTNDFGLFVADLSRESFLWCQSVVRKLGYKGLVTQFNCSPRLFDSAVRSELSPVVSYNSYSSHPSSGSRPGSRCSQASSVGSLANYIRGIDSVKLSGRPIIITEHNQAFWNKYQHEDGLLFSSYAAFQDFDVVMVHEDPVELEIRDPMIDFTVARNPVARANEFLAACFFKRGDVAPSPHRVELAVPRDYLDRDNHGNLAISSEQNKISLMTGFSLTFPDRGKPGEVARGPGNPDMTLLPSSGSEIKSGDWSVSISEAAHAPFSLDRIVGELKSKSILPVSNLSDPSKGIFQSDTGEIVLRGKENLLKVITPRSEGVSLEAGKSEALSCLAVENSSTPATVAACSIDGRNLDASSHIVLVYSTEAANSGMTLSADRVTLVKLGGLPVLMRTGKLMMTLKSALGSKMALFALGMDGTRGERIPVRVDENGLIHIEIDTAALKDGPTPFFELVANP